MKLHLPVLMLRSLLAFSVTLSSPVYAIRTSLCEAAEIDSMQYAESVLNFTDRQTSEMLLSDYDTIQIGNIVANVITWENPEGLWVQGGAIYNKDCESAIHNNGTIVVSSNAVSSEASAYTQGGAIYCENSDFKFFDNKDVIFRANIVESNYSGGAYGGAIANMSIFSLTGNENVSFEANAAAAGAYSRWSSYASGGAIFNQGKSLDLSDNHRVIFNNNVASSSVSGAEGGAIDGGGTIILRSNGSITFSANKAIGGNGMNVYAAGGAIDASYEAIIQDNGKVLFVNNAALCREHAKGGAIYSSRKFLLTGNGSVSFKGNTAESEGGAIISFGDFSLLGNGNVDFTGNKSVSGGAIRNYGNLTIEDNGDIIFKKNVEVTYGSYRLRSIVSSGTLNLSAKERHSIVFCDSLYASGTVNLNQSGMGNIIFTAATTEKDLQEMKGGIAGDYTEIQNSKTSEFATNAKLYGGCLSVEYGAILKGQGITMTEGSNATLRLNNARLVETKDVFISSGGTLELEGDNTLSAGAVMLVDGAIINFVMGEGNGTYMAAELITGQLNVNLKGDLFHEHRLLRGVYDYDLQNWTSDAVTVSGASFESLSWNDGALIYTPHVITTDEDGMLDDVLPDDGNAIIDASGHTLRAKNPVQLVQMALKDGIVKLEGENNGIVSVTLTEGGELVLTAGAGLKTGDIISMVASGKGKLVISGDITLDNKGMKGKAGAQATVSHADAKVLGDATISNVRVEDSTIDLAEGSTVGFEHVVLAATTRITDDPATAKLDDVTAELVLGVNTSMTGQDMLLGNTTLTETGNTGRTLTFPMDTTVLSLEASTFDSLTLSGSSLVLELAGMTLEMFNDVHFVAVSFTGGTDYATFDPSLSVTLSIDGVCYETGYIVESDDKPKKVYFRGGATPEPATTTLSLLALTALAARRKRK